MANHSNRSYSHYLSLPPKIQFELAHPAGPGDRHEQIKRLVCSLSAAGMAPDEVFGTLRPRYAADVGDDEIHSLIEWASKKCFTNRPFQTTQRQSISPYLRPALIALSKQKEAVSTVDADSAKRNTLKWLNGFSAGPEYFFERSPWRPLKLWTNDSFLLLVTMYEENDNINIVTEHKNGKPIGRGITKSRDAWRADFRNDKFKASDAGAWIRMNPVDGNGIADSNVVAYRFALIENDKLSIDLQLSLFAKLPLPINALIASGDKSIHAWIRLDAPSAEEYRRRLKEDILPVLTPFGFDRANTNPSRLARLPGVIRKLTPSSGTGEQRLIYCAPDVQEFRTI